MVRPAILRSVVALSLLPLVGCATSSSSAGSADAPPGAEVVEPEAAPEPEVEVRQTEPTRWTYTNNEQWVRVVRGKRNEIKGTDQDTTGCETGVSVHRSGECLHWTLLARCGTPAEEHFYATSSQPTGAVCRSSDTDTGSDTGSGSDTVAAATWTIEAPADPAVRSGCVASVDEDEAGDFTRMTIVCEWEGREEFMRGHSTFVMQQ